MEKTAVFIDGAYLDNVLYYEHGGVKVNYRILVETMVGADTLLRTYYYHCPPYQPVAKVLISPAIVLFAR